jgi:amyloid beta precursor protein binding protein 1
MQEKDQFRELIKAKSRNFFKEENFKEAFTACFKCFQTPDQAIRDSVHDVLNDDKINDLNEKSKFWLLAAALARFKETTGLLPLSGKVPDMTSTTDLYITIQNM